MVPETISPWSRRADFQKIAEKARREVLSDEPDAVTTLAAARRDPQGQLAGLGDQGPGRADADRTARCRWPRAREGSQGDPDLPRIEGQRWICLSAWKRRWRGTHTDGRVLVLGTRPLRPLALREGNPDAKIRCDVVVVLDPPPVLNAQQQPASADAHKGWRGPTLSPPAKPTTLDDSQDVATVP